MTLGSDIWKALQKADIAELGVQFNKALADIPSVAVTANAFKEDKEEAANVGMQAHIAKPLDIEEMLKTLSSVLSARDN